MLLNTSRITLKCFYMRFGWLTPRRFFNYPYPYGRIGQPCGLGLSVTMCFKTLLRQTKILSLSFSVFQIFHETSMFLDQSKTNAKLNNQPAYFKFAGKRTVVYIRRLTSSSSECTYRYYT